MPIVLDYAIEKRPIQVSAILERCGNLLLDAQHVRWSTLELIDWINEAVGEILNLKPAAGAKSAVYTLVPGTLQALPDNVIQLLKIDRNIAADGVTPGRVVTITDQSLMNHSDPDWHKAKPKAEIRHYMYDERVPRVFYVYPPALAATRVQLAYAELPEEVTSPDDTIGLNPEFAAAITNYVMFRAMSKDSEYSNAAAAVAYQQAFMGSMGAEVQGEQATSPNRAKP